MLTRLLCALALVAVPLTPVLAAETVAFPMGAQTIQVPVPDGFEPITADMAPAYEAWTALTAPTNVEPFGFITHHDADIARAGDLPSYKRTYSVQYLKTFAHLLVARSDMAEFKKVIREKNTEILRSLNTEEMGQQGSDALSGLTQNKVALSFQPIVPMAPHDEGEQYLSYSARIHMTVSVNRADGPARTKDFDRIATLSFVWVKGRVVFLYVYGEEADLAWTREAAHTWVQQVIAANR